MSVHFCLSLTSSQETNIRNMLLGGKSEAAVVIALCGQRLGNRRHKMVVRELYRTFYPCRGSTLLEEINGNKNDMAAVVFMSVSDDFNFYDEKHREKFAALQSTINKNRPFSVVGMFPNGQLAGHVFQVGESIIPLEVICVVGDDIHFWYANNKANSFNDFCASHAQLFGEGTAERLKRLSVAVVGCSGTGSPLIEQLARLGVGELVLVDNDLIEERNLNRIYNSSKEDAQHGRLKVDVLAEAIKRIGLGTSVIPISQNLWTIETVKAVAQCDIVFGCMDKSDGRYLLNALATYYTIPYFDIGIRLEAEPAGANRGKIKEVCGGIHYLQPGRSSLISREVISMKKVGEDGLQRRDPSAHAQERRDGYISGVEEHRPAVISVNSLAASLAVNEMLARIHPYREEGNNNYAQLIFSLSSMEILADSEGSDCQIFQNRVGIGDTNPLLGEFELSFVEVE
jgi:hypothetical protein